MQLSELQSGSCGDKIPSAPLRNTCLLAAWMNAYLVSFKTRLEFTSELRKTLGRILLHCLVIFFSVVGCFVLFVLKCHFQFAGKDTVLFWLLLNVIFVMKD